MKNSAKHSSYSAKQLTQIGLMTAIICIVGPFSIPLPFSPVPLSFTTLAIYLAVFVLGMKHGTCSCFHYLLLGTIGLPVFSGFSGGLSRLAGPTGGYLIGFLLLALIMGFFLEHFPKNFPLVVTGILLGTAVCYLFGTLWLANQVNLHLTTALAIGVLLYLPGDAIKIILAIILGPKLQKNVNALS